MPLQKFVNVGTFKAPWVGTFNARELLVTGDYRPLDGETAGIASEAALVEYDGDFVTTYHGQKVRDLDIEGKISIRHDGCEFDNVRANGLTYTSGYYLICDILQARATGSQTIFRDCAFRAPVGEVTEYPCVTQGRQAQFLRCSFYGATDGIGMQGVDVHILGGHIYGQEWRNQTPGQGGGLPWNATTNPGGGTHNDGIQIHGGTGLWVIGTAIEMDNTGAPTQVTSCILASPTASQGQIVNMKINKNWLISKNVAGTGTGLNLIWNGSSGVNGTYANSEISDNWFSPLNTFSSNHAGLIDSEVRDACTVFNKGKYVGTNTEAKVTIT